MADHYDLVIVGMGSGGMVAAEFAATLDLKVAIAERGRVGGDCLWTGCVPSKTLIASGKVAHHMRHADDWGLEPAPPTVDRARVWERIRSVQQDVASTDDNPQRFVDMGLDLIYGGAWLTGPNTVVVKTEAGDRELNARYILLCTGSQPAVPNIDGLESTGFVTSETLFELTDPPASFVNIGGGPIAVEMVQGFTRLGIPTTLLQKGPRILPRDAPALVDTQLVELFQRAALGVATAVRQARAVQQPVEQVEFVVAVAFHERLQVHLDVGRPGDPRRIA